jgi:hypothetical protein
LFNYAATCSIRPTQCSGSNRPEAKAAMISNTGSENPPMFRMSALSDA